MFRLRPCILALLTAVGSNNVLHAQDFVIDLKAQTGQPAQVAVARYPDPAALPGTRRLLTAAVKTRITCKWTVQYTGGAMVQDALIHCFVVKEDKLAQQQVPKLNKNVILESALTMDFKAKARAQGEATFTIPQAGVWLLRVEIKGTAAREPFAALDLLVK